MLEFVTDGIVDVIEDLTWECGDSEDSFLHFLNLIWLIFLIVNGINVFFNLNKITEEEWEDFQESFLVVVTFWCVVLNAFMYFLF